MSLISQSSEWKALEHLQKNICKIHICDLFTENEKRGEKFSCNIENLFVDYSRNRITQEALDLLFALARKAQYEVWLKRLFAGEIVNHSNNMSAMHPALRGSGANTSAFDEINATQTRMLELAETIRQGQRTGYGGKPFTDIVHLGIGGSGLGASMISSALSSICDTSIIHLHYVSLCDSGQIQTLLKQLDVETTLFLVVSKSFTATETLLNAEYAKKCVHQHYGNPSAWKTHFIAVSSDKEKVKAFGISEDNFLWLPSSIGGRYSVWSATSLAVAILIGADQFKQLLAGAYAMDQYVLSQPLEENVAAILALIGIWYANFFHASSRVILPYNYALRHLPAYLQQLEMESCGKSVTRNNELCDYQTAPVTWGSLGIEGQHSYYQLLHQGTQLIPADFIISSPPSTSTPTYERKQRAYFLAQIQALTSGSNTEEALFRQNHGNQPCNAIVLKDLSAYSIGNLLALYEHRTFLQAMVWQINPFDQWGVELGKQMSQQFLADDDTAENEYNTVANLKQRLFD